MPEKIPTVLVVDDSAFMRKLIAEMVELDLTVQAVEDGKRAAHAIDHALSAPRA